MVLSLIKKNNNINFDHQKDRKAVTAGAPGSGIKVAPKHYAQLPQEVHVWAKNTKDTSFAAIESYKEAIAAIQNQNPQVLQFIERAFQINEASVRQHQIVLQDLANAYQSLTKGK